MNKMRDLLDVVNENFFSSGKPKPQPEMSAHDKEVWRRKQLVMDFNRKVNEITGIHMSANYSEYDPKTNL